MDSLDDLPFYLSGPMPCPYLPDRMERKLFTRLDYGTDNPAINAALCRAGFRRSHDIVYRPACGTCNACIPTRLPVRLFHPSDTQRRTAQRNGDLIWTRADAGEPLHRDERYALFKAYQDARHTGGEMATMDVADFEAMLGEGAAATRLYDLRNKDGTLRGCMIADPAGDGLSAVYSFYDPAEPRRSLGTQLILSLIEAARVEGLAFIYLGYWVAGSAKMAYKARFQPQQHLGPTGWDWAAANRAD